MPYKQTDFMGGGFRKRGGYSDWDEEWEAAFLDEDDVSRFGDSTWPQVAIIIPDCIIREMRPDLSEQDIAYLMPTAKDYKDAVMWMQRVMEFKLAKRD